MRARLEPRDTVSKPTSFAIISRLEYCFPNRQPRYCLISNYWDNITHDILKQKPQTIELYKILSWTAVEEQQDDTENDQQDAGKLDTARLFLEEEVGGNEAEHQLDLPDGLDQRGVLQRHSGKPARRSQHAGQPDPARDPPACQRPPDLAGLAERQVKAHQRGLEQNHDDQRIGGLDHHPLPAEGERRAAITDGGDTEHGARQQADPGRAAHPAGEKLPQAESVRGH